MSRFASLRRDAAAGFQVSLIALPLCFGIALASGFPPMAGVIAAIVGGLLVSRINGSNLTINGPAAGLIVVILAGVDRLGHGDTATGYKLTLAAIVVAGLIQVVFGLLRIGRLAVFFPSAAVHGMMGAIGITVFAKQLPVMLGSQTAAKGVFGIFADLPQIIAHMNPLVAGIGITGLFAVTLIPTLKLRIFKMVPAPVWAVAAGALVAAVGHFERHEVYSFFGSAYALGPDIYLKLPANVFGALGRPDFSQYASADFLITVISIALVASLETLLSAAAIDRLDPKRRKSNLDRDLLAIGVGTTISGLLGGLPMIAEIVRSTANVNNGARTGWANFFHGAFLAIAVLVFPWVLTRVPLASLAALLVYTGFRLGSPLQFKHAAANGRDQLVVFVTTVAVVLATDLLIGIAAGVACEVALNLARRVSPLALFRCRSLDVIAETGATTVRVLDPIMFTNVFVILKHIAALPADRSIILDLTDTPFVDHTALEKLEEVRRERKLEIRGHQAARQRSRLRGRVVGGASA